jgi:hypothetical protein
VARLSRWPAGCLCWAGSIYTYGKCRLLLPRRCSHSTLRSRTAAAIDESPGGACAQQRMVSCCFRHNRKSLLRQQFYQGGISAISAAISLGLAAYAVLAKDRPSGRAKKRDPMRTRRQENQVISKVEVRELSPVAHATGLFLFFGPDVPTVAGVVKRSVQASIRSAIGREPLWSCGDRP